LFTVGDDKNEASLVFTD